MTVKEEDVGYIFFTQFVQPVPIETVKNAADKAKLPDDVVREIKPWNAFKRAMDALTKQGIISRGNKGLLRDKVEDGTKLVFQFTPKFLEGQGIRYDTKAAELVSFDKDTSKIDCSDTKILSVAERLFKDALTIFHSGDIHRIAERLCSQFRRISLKDGVYFVPKGHEKTLDQLEAFYEAVGGGCWIRPINHTSRNQKMLVRTIIADLKASMETLRGELDKFRTGKKGKSGITKEIAGNRLKELRKMYEQYRELAVAIKTSIDEVFTEAGDSAMTLVQAIGDPALLIQAAIAGKKIDPTALELAAIATESEASLPAGLIKKVAPAMPVEQGEESNVAAVVGRKNPVVPVAD